MMFGLSNKNVEDDGLYSETFFTIRAEIVTLLNTLLVGAVGARRYK